MQCAGVCWAASLEAFIVHLLGVTQWDITAMFALSPTLGFIAGLWLRGEKAADQIVWLNCEEEDDHFQLSHLELDDVTCFLINSCSMKTFAHRKRGRREDFQQKAACLSGRCWNITKLIWKHPGRTLRLTNEFMRISFMPSKLEHQNTTQFVPTPSHESFPAKSEIWCPRISYPEETNLIQLSFCQLGFSINPSQILQQVWRWPLSARVDSACN